MWYRRIVFEDQAEQDVATAVELVKNALAVLGVDASSARSPQGDAVAAFELRRGSARVRIAVFGPTEGRSGMLRVLAPVVALPPSSEERGLYRRLLEVNARDLAGAAFGITDKDVVLVAERSVADLDGSEVDALLETVSRAADHFDDLLAREFNTRRSSDS